MNNKEKIERQDDSSGDGTQMDLSAERRTTQARAPAANPPDDRHGMSPDLQAHIGRHLRALFDEVAQEPVPDRFLQLLKDLEKNEPQT